MNSHGDKSSDILNGSEVLLAEPRGFCAGVDRAIEIVERALSKFGAPIYVRHEIVHNTFVVNDLKSKGVNNQSTSWDELLLEMTQRLIFA